MNPAPAPPRDKRLVSLLWATIDHADELAQCHATLFPEPWDADGFRQFLSHPGSVALIARQGLPQQTVGFIVGQLAADEAEVQGTALVGKTSVVFHAKMELRSAL